jgi:hypothetical protein
MYSHNFVVSSLYVPVSGPDPLLYEDQSESHGARICIQRGTGASWADIDNDGFLDLYGVEYDPSRLGVDHVSVLLMNDGTGSFENVTAEAGLDLGDNAMGVAFADYDNDGDQDVFATNSHEVPSRLYENRGPDPVTGVPVFVDVGPVAGVSVVGEPNRGVGATWGDVNNDGRLDLLYSREDDSHLWVNNGPDAGGIWTFTDIVGVGGFDLTGEPGVGHEFWGGGIADLDNNGWMDVVLTDRSPFSGNLVFLNNGDGTWLEVSEELGMRLTEFNQFGFVPGDIDNDGDLDFALSTHNPGDQNFFFRNESRGNNWIQVRLTGTTSNRDAVGARIELSAALQRGQPLTTQVREVNAGAGFFADYPRIQTFGLAKATEARRVRVRWPSGIVQEVGPFEVNQRIDIVEPLP